jgi:F-type H+-transporting ATPase subunit epsilon
MPQISFKIVTPERVTYENEIEQATIPTKAGEITVLANHAPLVGILSSGELRVVKDGAELSFAVSTGFLEIRPKSEIVILADTAERAEDIDRERAEEARRRAEKMLEEKEQLDDVQFARLQAVLDREMARIKVKNRLLTKKGLS